MAPKVENKQGRFNLSEFIISLKLQMFRWFEHEFVDMNEYEKSPNHRTYSQSIYTFTNQ
jgi:hypothetical protein